MKCDTLLTFSVSNSRVLSLRLDLRALERTVFAILTRDVKIDVENLFTLSGQNSSKHDGNHFIPLDTLTVIDIWTCTSYSTSL